MEVYEKLKNGFEFSKFDVIAFGAISILVMLCYDKWRRRPFEKLASKMTGPPGYPILGNGLEFTGSPEKILKTIVKLFREYGSEPCKVWLGSSLFVTIVKPVDIQVILNSSKALEKGALYKFFKFVSGEGLFSAPVEKWRRNRRLIAPVFKNNLKEFLSVFNEKNQILVEKLKTKINQPFDLWQYIAPCNLSAICQNSMDYDLDFESEEAIDFIEATSKICEWDAVRISKPWLYTDIMFSLYITLTGKAKFYKIFRELPKKVIQRKKNVFSQKEKEVEQPKTDDEMNDTYKSNKSFVDMLLELNKAGAQFSDKEVEDEVVTFLIGGTETTAITVCSCLLLLAMHQDIQDKVYAEIYEVFGDSDEIFTMDHFYKFVYLEQVIKETLRVYPTAPIILRQTQDDVKLVSGDHVLRKGTTCLLSPFITHHLPEIYPDPWSFNPENFSAENVAKRHTYSFIPFSRGPRACVGSKYAMLSMKVQISKFLRHYSVHTSLKMSDVRLEWSFLLRHAIGFPVTIQPRVRTRK